MSAKIYTTALFAVLLTGLFSCQKVIHVDLNDAAPRYVVEGNITNLPGPYTVKITRTINFDQDNNFPGVTGAIVVVTDSNTNSADTLAEVTAGIYQTHTIAGTPGHTYKLAIQTGGLTFSCASTMPQPVLLDSVYLQAGTFRKTNTVAVATFTDPAASGNCYHLTEQVNDSVSQSIFVYDDEIENGRQFIATMNRSLDINPGDVITVGLECVDRGVYQYYFNLEQTIRQNSASPANPQSNITGGALGYFSAHTIQTRSIVAP